ncbi:MAG: histidine phosphatase family protein [Chloroflexota bacterium]|nr:histidine phosphatase family protein [Chloroflexota bacterium]
MSSNPQWEYLPTTLILCRHGESKWNIERRIQGQSPLAPGLSAEGRWQARRLANRLQQEGADILYTSDLKRAYETAEIVGSWLGLRLRTDQRWREVNLGRWQGLTGQEAKLKWPEEWAALENGEDVPRGGGETLAQVQRRVTTAARDLMARHEGRTIAVVCHGGAIRTCIAGFEDYALDNLREQVGPIYNCSVTILEHDGDRLEVLTVADVSHLETPG